MDRLIDEMLDTSAIKREAVRRRCRQMMIVLLRYHSAPEVMREFVIDRRAMHEYMPIGMSSGEIRTVRKKLELIGFTERVKQTGSLFKPYDPKVGPRRKATVFQFGEAVRRALT